MRFFIFKSPKKQGDRPIETLDYEPNELIISQRAAKYGPIIIISEESLLISEPKKT